MTKVLFNVINDFDALCVPCGDPPSPQGAASYEVSTDNQATWTVVADPQLEDVNVGDFIRINCPDGSHVIEVTACDQPNSYFSQTVDIELGVNPPIEVSFPCCSGQQIWQIRVDDPNTGEETFTWQTLDLPLGTSTIFIGIEEEWLDNLDPNGLAPNGQLFGFSLRASCDNGQTFQPEIRIDLQT